MGGKVFGMDCCNCKGYDDPDSYVIKVWEGLKLCHYEYSEFEEKSLLLLQKLNMDNKKTKVMKSVSNMSPKDYLVNPSDFEKIAESMIIDPDSKNNPFQKIHLSFINSIVNQKKKDNESINFIGIQFTFFSFMRFNESAGLKKYNVFFKILLNLGNTNALSWIYFRLRFKEYLELNLVSYTKFITMVGDYGDTGLHKDDFDALLKDRYNSSVLEEFADEIFQNLYEVKKETLSDTYIVTLKDFEIMFDTRDYVFNFSQLRYYLKKKQENNTIVINNNGHLKGVQA